MLKFTRDMRPDLDLYSERIKSNGYVWMDIEGLSHQAIYESIRRDTLYSLSRSTMDADMPLYFIDMGRNAVYTYLTKVKGCPDYVLSKRGVAGFSLDADKVLTPLLERGKAVEFLSTYIEYSSLKSVSSRATGLVERLSYSGEINVHGRKLGRLHYDVSQQQNLRYNYHNTDLISIPKLFNNKFSVPEGYCLVWGDFRQSDARIAYNTLLRDENNADIMDEAEDTYEGFLRLLAKAEGMDPDIVEFKQNRDDYKKYMLASIYGQSSNLSGRGTVIVNRMQKFLETCERYQEYKKRLASLGSLGLPVRVDSYFGHTEIIMPGNGRSLITKALNTPVQTGTSEVVILTVNALLDQFYSLGYTEDDVKLYMVRHDEIIFMCKEETLKDAWIFRQAEQIIVDDWTPLQMTFEYGRNYTVPDSDLTEVANESFARNYNRIDTVHPTPTMEPYIPVKKPFTVVVSHEVVGDKAILCVHSNEDMRTKFYLVDSTDPNEIYKVLRDKLIASESNILRSGAAIGVIVYNTFKNEDIKSDFLFYKFKIGQNVKMSYSNILAHYMACKYAKREGIDHKIREFELELNSKIINEVLDFDLLQN